MPGMGLRFHYLGHPVIGTQTHFALYNRVLQDEVSSDNNKQR